MRLKHRTLLDFHLWYALSKEHERGSIMDYEKKIIDQQWEINRLKEQVAGMGQIDRVADALILSVLMAVGADQNHPVVIDKEKISELLHADNICLAISPEPDGYSMHYVRLSV